MKFAGVALAFDPSADVPSRCGTQQGGPAWEAMHAPSLDGQRIAQARCQSAFPADHVMVGPGADRVRPPRRAVLCLLHQAVAPT